MSGPTNPMVITALLVLERPVPYEVIVKRLADRLVRHRRFRQRVVEPRFGLGMPRWEDDPHFDVRRHVLAISMQAHGPRVIDELVGELMSSPLETRNEDGWGDHPLWHMYVVDAATPALVMTVHHALADGVALLSLLEEIADDGAHTGTRSGRPDSDHGVFAQAAELVRGIFAAVRFALRRADPRTALRGAIGTWKRVAFSSALALDQMTGAAHALDTTVMGLLLAALAGALRPEVGPRDGLVLHALLPISIKRGRAAELGNHFGSVLVRLPVGIADRERRLSCALEEVRSLRSRSAAVVAGARLAIAAGLALAPIERVGVRTFSHKASVVVSNARGPRRTLHVAGVEIEDILFWAPLPGDIALGVTLMSYAGRVRISVAADAAVIGDPRRIVVGIERELAGLTTLAASRA